MNALEVIKEESEVLFDLLQMDLVNNYMIKATAVMRF